MAVVDRIAKLPSSHGRCSMSSSDSWNTSTMTRPRAETDPGADRDPNAEGRTAKAGLPICELTGNSGSLLPGRSHRIRPGANELKDESSGNQTVFSPPVGRSTRSEVCPHWQLNVPAAGLGLRTVTRTARLTSPTTRASTISGFGVV